MGEVGEVRAKFVAETGEWEAGIERIDNSIRAVGESAEQGFRVVQDELRQTKEAVRDAATAAEDATDKLTFAAAVVGAVEALGIIDGAINHLRDSLVLAGAEADDLGDRLRGPFADKAEEMRARIEAPLTFGFKADAIEKAVVTLNKFGQNTEENLRIIQDASRFTGVSVDTLAGKFGLLLEATDERTMGRAIKGLQRDLGASSKDLEEFGAKLDEAGKVLLDTPARAEAARQAILRLSEVKAGGAAERVADDTIRLQGEFELLKREIGGAIINFREGFSPALRQVVGEFRSLSPEMKTVIGLSVEFAGAATSMAAGALQVGANIALLAANKTVYTAATTAATAASGAFNASLAVLGGTFGVVLLSVGALAIGIHAWTEAIKGATKAEEELLAMEERRQLALKNNIDLIGKSAKQLQDMGKSSVDVVNVIDGLRDQLEAAKKTGNDVLIGQLEAKIRDAQKVKTELAESEAKSKQEREAAQKDAINDPSAKEQKKLDAEAARNKKAIEKELSDEKKRAEREKKDAEKATERERKEVLAEELAGIKNAASAKRISKAQEIAGLHEILETHKLVASERRQIEREIAHLTGQIEAEKTAAIKKAEAERNANRKKAAREAAAEKRKEELAEEEALHELDREIVKEQKEAEKDQRERQQAQKATRAAQVKELETEIKHLETVAVDSKANTVDQIAILLNKKLALELAEIEAERKAAADKATTAETLVAINQEAEAKTRTARAQTTRELEVEVERQKKIVKDAKGDSAFHDGPFDLAELAKQLKGTTTESRFGRATLDGVAKIGAVNPLVVAEEAVKNIQAKPVTSLTPNQKESANEVGAAVAAALKGMPLNFHLEVVNTDGSKDTKTLSGTLGSFPPKNVFNSKSPLGAR